MVWGARGEHGKLQRGQVPGERCLSEALESMLPLTRAQFASEKRLCPEETEQGTCRMSLTHPEGHNLCATNFPVAQAFFLSTFDVHEKGGPETFGWSEFLFQYELLEGLELLSCRATPSAQSPLGLCE